LKTLLIFTNLNSVVVLLDLVPNVSHLTESPLFSPGARAWPVICPFLFRSAPPQLASVPVFQVICRVEFFSYYVIRVLYHRFASVFFAIVLHWRFLTPDDLPAILLVFSRLVEFAPTPPSPPTLHLSFSLALFSPSRVFLGTGITRALLHCGFLYDGRSPSYRFLYFPRLRA